MKTFENIHEMTKRDGKFRSRIIKCPVKLAVFSAEVIYSNFYAAAHFFLGNGQQLERKFTFRNRESAYVRIFSEATE